MSKVIDERVVSMQFDNKHFEENVRTTMSTLDKLKAKLNFTNVGKSLENINTSSAKCNLSPLSNAVDNVGLKFNAMYTIADQALRNITNSAMAAGKKIINALTIDPVKTGFQEYETQINATQTILSNTKSKGSDIEDVNRALEELNKYADKTIYNFTEMTRNIGTFTAAGIDLDTSVNAIQGIANLAAVSGSTSQQASTAMYQLSQALASGTVKLMDWNSVVNAGMGGEMFQNALRETSELLGTGAEAAIKAEGSFRESLRSGWLTSEVLTRTLKKFTTAGANERVAEYTGLAKEAVDAALEAAEAQYGEADAIEHASKALAEKSGKNAEEIKSVLEFAKDAEDAATKVKTLTQLWDVMKESAQSGWAQTWKIVVGDFEEAKALFTPLADFFTGFINRMSDARNNLLQGALDLAAPWKVLTDKLNGAGLSNITKVTNSIGDMTDKLGEFQDVVNAVWRGDYKTADTGRYELLAAAGYDARVIQDLVNLGYDYDITVEDIEASHKKFGITLEKNADTTKKTAEILANLSDEELHNAGLTEAEIKLYRDLEAEAKRTGSSINFLAKRMSEVSGRTLLLESLKNAGRGLVTIFTAIGKAWTEIFPPMSVVRLYTIIDSIHRFSKKLVVTEETAKDLTRIFKGLFAVVDIVATVFGGAFRLAFKAASGVLSLFNLDILDALAYVGDMLVKLRDWIDEHSLLNKALDKFGPKIKEAVGSMKKWTDETKPMSKALEVMSNFFDKTSTSILNWIDGLVNTDDIFGYLLESIKSLPEKVFAGIKTLGRTLGDFLKRIFEKPLSVITAFKDNILSKLGTVGNGIGEFVQKIKDFVTDLDIGFGEIVTILVGTGMIVALVKFASTFSKVVNVLTNISDAFAGIGESISGAFNKIGTAAKLIGIAVAVGLLAKAFIELAQLEWGQIGKGAVALLSIGVILTGLAWALGFMSKKSIEITTGAATLLAIAGAIAILVYALQMVSQIESDNILADILTLGGIGLALVAVAGLLSKLAPHISKGSFTMIAIAGAILLLVHAISKIEALTITDPEKVIGMFAGVIAGLALVSKVANGMKVGSAVGILLMAGSILAFTFTIQRLADIDTAKIKANIEDIALILGMLAAVLLASRLAGANAGKAGFALVGISAALILVGVAIRVLASISPSDMAKGTDAITQILAMFALLTIVSAFAGKNAAKAGAMLIEMSVALLLISGSVFILSKIAQNNESGFDAASSCLMKLMGMFALIIAVSGLAKSAMGTIISLGIVLGLLTVAIGALSMIPRETLITATTCLSAVMGMLAVLIAVTGFINTVGATFLKTSVVLIVMAGVIYVLGTVIRQVAELEPQNALASAEALSILLLSLSAAMAIVSIAGTTGLAGLAGIGLFVAFIAAVGGLMAAINLVVSDAEAASDGLDVAIMVLEKIGTGIGSFIGGLIGGLGAGIFSGLESIAEDLNAFMGTLTKEGGFIESAKSVDGSAMDGIKNVMAILAMVTGVEFLSGLASMFTFKNPFTNNEDNGLTEMVHKLGLMGAALQSFSNATSDLSDADVERIGILSAASKALVEVADSVPNMGGKLAAWVGENDMSVFGVKLVSFGESLVSFGQSIRALTEDDVEKIKTSADAAMALTTMADSVPNMGGKLAEFFGENDLSVFGTKLISFGESLVLYAGSIRSLTEDDIDLINTSADAGIALGDMASAVPNMGGMLAEFFGENDLSDFGVELVSFGEMLVAYSESISGLTEEDIEFIKLSAGAAKALCDMAESVPNMGGAMAAIFGENSLSVFAADLVGFGDSIMAYATSVHGINDSHIESINKSGAAVEALVKVAKKVPNEGGFIGWIAGENNVAGFATGMTMLGSCINDYAKAASGINDDTIENIKNSKDAVEQLGKVAKQVPELDKGVNISSFANSMPTLGSAVSKYARNVSGISDDDVAAAKRSSKILDAFKDAVKKLPSGINDLSKAKVDSAISNIKKIIGFASEIDEIDTNGLSTLGDKLENTAKNGVKAFIQTFANSYTDVHQTGINLITKFATGLSDSSLVVKTVVTALMTSITSAMTAGSTSAYGAGANVAQGFARGISDYSGQAIARANAMANSVASIVKNALRINSPSKVFIEIGRSIPEGFAMGIGDFGSSIVKNTIDMSNVAIDSASNAIARIASVINTDIDSQPTIRPILDLSDVKSGANGINNLFGMQPSVDLLTNVGSVSTMMNERQNVVNTSNKDVVSAIDNLSKKLDNLDAGDTYNFNGITYDDGSNIHQALSSIVREVRLQERSR